MKALCLITFVPNQSWCDFLNAFDAYKIFMVVDNNAFDLSEFVATYQKITFIQVKNETCHAHGYIDTSFTLGKLVAGWDKALYYFGVENTTHDVVWFMEDDVYFHSEKTLSNVDNQYEKEDMLSNRYSENRDGNKKTWHWNKINIQQYPPPYYNGMMCCVRFSQQMMRCIHAYATAHKTLFFLEALFPTLAIKNNLQYKQPKELHTIHWRYNFTKKDMNTTSFYHPVKNITNHILFRTN